MRLGIIGPPQSGKSTVFDALTQSVSQPGHRVDDRIATIRVPDHRVDALSNMYQPKKTTFAQVAYFLPGNQTGRADTQGDQQLWTPVRDCDALILVVRNVTGLDGEKPDPAMDVSGVQQELIISDQIVVEKRLERIAQEKQRGRKTSDEERALLERCLELLERETPIRSDPELRRAKALKGFAFLTAKPILVLFNNADDDDALPPLPDVVTTEEAMVIRGKLEQELAQMTAGEAAEFLSEFGVSESAMDRVIQRSYQLLGLISFFTVGDDEVKAWTIPADTPAVAAAGEIHSDIQKGFIRAEVVAYDDLMAAGTYAEARKQAMVRLEGKTYPVQDGDIIHYRFNV
jgi:GTP-binding protein YchF